MNVRPMLIGLVVAAASINLALLALYFLFRENAQTYSEQTQFPHISGIDLNGFQRQIKDAPCYVIRVTSDECQYCKADQPAYAVFLDVAREASCPVVEIPPTAALLSEIPREGVTQIRYVDMALAEILSPRLTPQTLVLDEDRMLIWQRLGSFDDESLVAGVAALRSVGTP